MKLARILLEGQLWLAGIVAIFFAELGILLWGLWSRRPIVGLVAVFVTIPLMRSTVAAIRACFFRIRAPEGLPLDRSAGAALYHLAEDIGRAVGAPGIDSITISNEFYAAAAIYRPPWRLRRHRTLVLGLPVLSTLSTAELRAVIAHELAHFSSARDSFAAWVYRTRASWFAVRSALDQRLATPVYVYWLVRWYVPRLNTASAEVSRRHEVLADRVAADVAGRRAAADALLVFELGSQFAEDTYWPAIGASHETTTDPPRPYRGMLTWNARAVAAEAIEQLHGSETSLDDSHPSFRERFDRLGEPVRLPPTIARSAGQELLGDTLETLAAAFDEEWLTRHRDSWRRNRIKHVEQRATLARLTAIATPTPEETFACAELIEAIEGADEALPVYRRAAGQGHAAASLAAGRLLLDRREPHAVALIEEAMNQDETLVSTGCRLLAEFYRETGQELNARRCEWRATRHATQAHLRRTNPLHVGTVPD